MVLCVVYSEIDVDENNEISNFRHHNIDIKFNHTFSFYYYFYNAF